MSEYNSLPPPTYHEVLASENVIRATAAAEPQLQQQPIALLPYVYVGSRGYVFALNVTQTPATVAWNTSLPGTGYNPVTIVHTPVSSDQQQQPPRLYACTTGHLFCLDPATGALLWRLPPPAGFGSMDTPFPALLLAEERNQLIMAGGGNIAAVNCQTGAVMWLNDLKGTGYRPVQITRLPHGNTVFVGTSGQALALDIATGTIMWKTALRGSNVVSLVAVDGDSKERSPLIVAGTSGDQFILDSVTGVVLSFSNLGTYNTPSQLVIPPDGVNNTNVPLIFTALYGQCYATKPNTVPAANKENKKFAVWYNGLPGMGYTSEMAVAALPSGLLAVGLRGRVAALDSHTGVTKWTVNLPGCGYGLVVLLEDPFMQTLVVASGGYVYGLNDQTGQIKWGFTPALLERSNFSTLATATTSLDLNTTSLLTADESARAASAIVATSVVV